jgi:hypothetical protein
MYQLSVIIGESVYQSNIGSVLMKRNGLAVVLLLRIYVLYNRSRMMGIFIALLLFVGCVVPP